MGNKVIWQGLVALVAGYGTYRIANVIVIREQGECLVPPGYQQVVDRQAAAERARADFWHSVPAPASDHKPLRWGTQ